LANFSAYHRLKQSWYAARTFEHAAAAVEAAGVEDGVVEDDDLLRPNIMLPALSPPPSPLCFVSCEPVFLFSVDKVYVNLGPRRIFPFDP
jgi:hypothetical protein